MPHVLVAGKIHEAGLDLLRAAPGLTIDVVNEVTLEAYVGFLSGADALLLRTQPLTADLLKTAPRLRIVSRHGVGYDAVDVDALTARGIPLAVVGDVNSRAVAEHTMMMLLACARRTVQHHAAVLNGNWNVRNAFEATELDGKTLLIIGFGRIGRRVAQLAQAFGMRVISHDPFVDAAKFESLAVEAVQDYRSALPEADVVSVHMPASSTGPLLGAAEFSVMKASAIVINTARGGLIDETALDLALRAGRLAAAGFDVLSQEPPKADHPLLHSPRFTLSPHAAGLTAECAARMAVSAVQNILDCFAGHLDRKLVVNAAALWPDRTF